MTMRMCDIPLAAWAGLNAGRAPLVCCAEVKLPACPSHPLPPAAPASPHPCLRNHRREARNAASAPHPFRGSCPTRPSPSRSPRFACHLLATPAATATDRASALLRRKSEVREWRLCEHLWRRENASQIENRIPRPIGACPLIATLFCPFYSVGWV